MIQFMKRFLSLKIQEKYEKKEKVSVGVPGRGLKESDKNYVLKKMKNILKICLDNFRVHPTLNLLSTEPNLFPGKRQSSISKWARKKTGRMPVSYLAV